MLRKQRELGCSAGNKSKQKPQQSQPQQHMPRQVCCSPFVGRTGCSCGGGSRSAAALQNLLRSSGGGGAAPSWCSVAGREQIGQVRGGLRVQVFCATYCMRGKKQRAEGAGAGQHQLYGAAGGWVPLVLPMPKGIFVHLENATLY